MDRTELAEYLVMVLDVEKNLLAQNQLKKDLDVLLSRAHRPVSLPEPQEPVMPTEPTEPVMPKLPVEPQREYYTTNWKRDLLKGVAYFFGIVILAALLCMFIAPFTSKSLSELSDIIGNFVSIPAFLAVIWVFVSDKRSTKEKNAKAETHYQLEMNHYQHDLQECQKKLARDQQIYKMDMEDYHRDMDAYKAAMVSFQEQKVQFSKDLELMQLRHNDNLMFIKGEISRTLRGIQTSTAHLTRLYSSNIIFPKYRNLPMVASLYEYISSGRCSSLDGYGGAYNILETELRLDKVITQLDTVISQLEQIKSNQYVLYSAIRESTSISKELLKAVETMSDRIVSAARGVSNQIADSMSGIADELKSTRTSSEQISSKLDDLQSSSALSAYYAQRTQKELQYMNRMDYISGRNDAAFWNVPPT